MHLAIFQGYMQPVTPENFDSTPGVYGSELAYIKITQEIRRFCPDWKITVFGTYPGRYEENGIEYINNSMIWSVTENEPNYDAMIVSRYLFLFIYQDYKKIADRYYFWAHDVQPLYWVGREHRQDLHNFMFHEPFVNFENGYTVCFSNYHRQLYHQRFGIPLEKIRLIGHGTNFVMPENPPPRDPYRFMFSSSLDRGVDNALRIFRIIHKKHPQTSLHVFYGCKDQEQVQRVVDEPGVTYHGKIPSDQVPLEYAKSNYWLYPTEFHETYGITSIEAQRGGAIPLTSGIGALQDNVADRGMLLGKVEHTDDWFESRAGFILDLMEHPKSQEKMREVCQAWSKDITWEHSALNWIVMILKDCKK